MVEQQLSKFPPRLQGDDPPWPGAADTCVKMPDTSSEVLHKYTVCLTVKFQRVTQGAVIVYTTVCVNDESVQRGLQHPRRCPHVHGEKGNTEDTPIHSLQLSLLCIYSSHLTSLNRYLSPLNVFDLFLTLMQTC